MSSSFSLARTARRNWPASSSGSPRWRRAGIERGAQEIHVVHARDLDRVLEGEEHALARPLVGRHRQQVAAEIAHAALGDLIARRARPAPRRASILPEPFGPMIACTSPASTERSMPLRISRPSVEARVEVVDFEHFDGYPLRRALRTSGWVPGATLVAHPEPAWRNVEGYMRIQRTSSDAAFEAHGEELLRLDRELHRQFLQDFLQKPLTISDSASSCESPRWRQ